MNLNFVCLPNIRKTRGNCGGYAPNEIGDTLATKYQHVRVAPALFGGSNFAGFCLKRDCLANGEGRICGGTRRGEEVAPAPRNWKRFLKGLLVEPPWSRSSHAKTLGALEAEENCARGDSPENGSRAP